MNNQFKRTTPWIAYSLSLLLTIAAVSRSGAQSTGYAGGGGGGTFIINQTAGTPILISGGGGGTGEQVGNVYPPGPAPSPIDASPYNVTSGAPGNTNIGFTCGAYGGGSGGGGYTTNGVHGAWGGVAGSSYTNGGNGGANTIYSGTLNTDVPGGFGGGAGAGTHINYEADGGGGGGYSGGGGSSCGSGSGGGGGNLYTGTYVSSGLNTGNGFVIITSGAVTYSFTNAGATGVAGPSQVQVNTAYSGTSLAGAVTVTGAGIQLWTVPATGTYTITAAGASGGYTPNYAGGKGRSITIQVALTAGNVLAVLVGQEGGRAYFGTPPPITITTGSITGSPFCIGSTASVPYTTFGTFNGGNTFTAQLSNASGSFASPIASASGPSPITLTIPAGAVNGSGYLVRVIASSPSTTGSTTGISISVPTATISGTATICSGSSTNLTFTGTPGATVTYSDGTTNSTATLTGGSATVSVSPLINTTYTISTVANGSCTTTISGQSATVSVSKVIVTTTVTGASGGNVQVQPMTFPPTPNPTVTFSGSGNMRQAGGRAAFYSNINTNLYNGLWFTYSPILNPYHSSQGQTGNMVFNNYNPATGIMTFTSTAPMSWNTAFGYQSVNTQMRVQFQPYTGTNSGPIGSGWIVPVTAGGISLASLPAGYPLLNIKALGATAQYQVWSIIEETSNGVQALDDYYNSTNSYGGSTFTSVTGTFYSSTYTACAGSATVTVAATGGTAPYNGTGTYPLANGTTNYPVSDANACSGTAAITATVNPQPQGSLAANGPFCASGTGQLTFTATAGTGPFTVVYNDGIANRTATGVVSGAAFAPFTNPVTASTTYTLVSVTDANCVRSTGFSGATATITVNPLANASISGTTAYCSGNGPATIIFTGTPNATVTYNVGGGADQTIALGAGGSNSISVSPAATSVYTATSVTSSANCVNTLTGQSATVTIYPLPTVAIASTTNVACFGQSTGSITTTATGGTPGYNYLWTPGNVTTANRTGIPAGTYSVTISDQHNCTSSASATLTEPSALAGGTTTGTFAIPNCPAYNLYLGYGATNDTLTTAASGGTSPYSYAWTPAAGTTILTTKRVVTPAATTTYTATITDGHGCVATTSYQVKVLDIHCGPAYVGRERNNTVTVCHNGVSACISPALAATYINGGECPGTCNTAVRGVAENTVTNGAHSFTGLITVYPNPAHTTVNVQLTGIGSYYKSYQIIDLTGKLIAQQNAGEGSEDGQVDVIAVNVSRYVPGVYLIRVAGKDGIGATARFTVE